MITVWATEDKVTRYRFQLRPTFYLKQIKIRKESIEIMQDLGSFPCDTHRDSNNIEKGTTYEGPICVVRMTSGLILYINATSEELEARSA